MTHLHSHPHPGPARPALRRALSACGLALLLLLLAALPLAAHGDAEAPEVPPIELPQARVNRIDVSQLPLVRVFATVLDRNGKPVQLKAIKKLAVADGKQKSKPPYAAFQLGQPLDGHKDWKLQLMDKTGVASSVVFVVAGYQDDALRKGSLGRRLKEALVTAFKPLGKTDRANVVWYNDRLYRYVGLKGKTGELTDVEESRKLCQAALAEARAGEEITGAGPAGKDKEAPAPGTDLCGLTADHKAIVELVQGQQTAYEGYFPRLFNLGQPFFAHGRYCKPPREALQKYGEFTPENATVQASARERRRLQGEPLDYQTSAFDEALRLLLQDAKAGEQKAIVLVSDGRDGYFRDLELCQENPPANCQGLDDHKKRQACIAGFLKQRLIAQQGEFKARAAHWIGLARAADVRVFAVGLGMLGEDFELERLRLLAERTGGTYRRVDKEENLAGELAATVREMTGQLAVEFLHPTPEDPGKALSVRLQVELDPTMVRGDQTKLQSAPLAVAIPEPLTWRQQLEKTIRTLAAKLQDVLGYKLYVAAGLAVLALAALVVLLVMFLIVRKIVRKVTA